TNNNSNKPSRQPNKPCNRLKQMRTSNNCNKLNSKCNKHSNKGNKRNNRDKLICNNSSKCKRLNSNYNKPNSNCNNCKISKTKCSNAIKRKVSPTFLFICL